MNDTAVQVNSLSKTYRLGASRNQHLSLREVIAAGARRALHPKRERKNDGTIFDALNGVSFTVRRGEVIGIIGRNGAGKSTLLKVLSHITAPSSGRVEIHGRIGSLLEVGTGFHPELTGRENIYLNGAILGMKRADIRRRFDDIVAFAEVERFLDTPVKHYSSGMYVRLAFAVAAHLEPDILVIDEVLAVGDAAFQRKCLGKMSDIGDAGRTVLFVSHSMATIQKLCSRTIWLDHGQVVGDGPTAEVVERYVLATLSESRNVGLRNVAGRQGSGEVRIVDFRLEDTQGRLIDLVTNGQDAHFIFDYETQDADSYSGVTISLHIQTMMGDDVIWVHNKMTGDDLGELPPTGQFRCCIPSFPLAAGSYLLRTHVSLHDGHTVADDLPPFTEIHVIDGDFHGTGYPSFIRHSPFLTRARWLVSESSEPRLNGVLHGSLS